MHEINLFERRPCSIFETVRGIVLPEFTLITSTMQKTAGLLQHHRVLEVCSVMAATGLSNHVVDNALVEQVDDLGV